MRRDRAGLSAAAARDLTEAIEWIAEDNPPAARALRHAVRSAAYMLASKPLIGRVRPDITSRAYRFYILTGFPYVLVYDPAPRPPVVARIIHGARDLPALLADP